MAGRFDTPGKNAVREFWNTPVLQHIHRTYGIKYRYLGLPGTELIDINLWREMIEDVVAFEVTNEGSDERANIKKLKRNLAKLGINNSVYYGSMEYVILMREDLDGLPYKQDKVITLYNLDFCDEITSRVDVVGGEKCLRFAVIRQILADQHACYKQDTKQNLFMILLTTRNQIHSKRISKYLFGDDLHTSTDRYIQDANVITPIPTDNEGHRSLLGTHGWALKAFVFDTIIHSYFPNPHITCLVFPMIKYYGIPIDKETESPMIHWMILCKFEDPVLPRPKIYPNNFLTKHSLRAEKYGIFISEEPGEKDSSLVDPLKILKKYEKHFFKKS